MPICHVDRTQLGALRKKTSLGWATIMTFAIHDIKPWTLARCSCRY
jgi:hypothetical protein